MPLPEAVQFIVSALEKGNVGGANLFARQMINELPDYPWGPYMMALTAGQVGASELVRDWCDRTATILATQPANSYPEIAAGLENLKKANLPAPVVPTQPAYLLIKSWGYGFWSDVEHVMSSLVLAEATGRTPVVRWGGNSYYTDNETVDCFSTFFKPVSDADIDDVLAVAGGRFPEKWNEQDLRRDGFNVWEGEGARQSGLYFLNRPEQVAVSDFFTQMMELLPWLAADHWLSGKDSMTAMRLVYEKYFRLQPDIQNEVDAFVAANFDERPILAVHARNSDKDRENPDFEAETQEIFPIIDRHLSEIADLRIFLLTDSTDAVATFDRLYGDRVFYNDVARTSDHTPLTWIDTNKRYRLGVEIILDTYAAVACDYFIGNGSSNVPAMVEILKDWDPGHFHLIGDNIKVVPNWLLHDW